MIYIREIKLIADTYVRFNQILDEKSNISSKIEGVKHKHIVFSSPEHAQDELLGYIIPVVPVDIPDIFQYLLVYTLEGTVLSKFCKNLSES